MAIPSGTIADIVIGAAAATSGTVLGIKKWKDNRARKTTGIPPNPQRCIDHETRLRTVESACIEYRTEIGTIKEDVKEIKGDVKELLKR